MNNMKVYFPINANIQKGTLT